MHKKDYLAGAVADFSSWFGGQFANTQIRHTYNPPHAKSQSFAGLEEAFDRYRWEFCVRLPGDNFETRGHTFQDNEAVLGRLRLGLANVLSIPDSINRDLQIYEWSVAVLGWGSARPHNELWLVKNREGLSQDILAGMSIVAGENDSIEQVTSHFRRFNAGMSKLYSLLVPSAVIYDSRVAGALAWFVTRWCIETRRERVPDTLAFPCLIAKENQNPQHPKIRNPSHRRFKFPTLRHHPATFAHWNMRASWILQAALDSAAGSRFKNSKSPLRALEAALFMWGYDLTPLITGRPSGNPSGKTDIEPRPGC